MLILLCAQSAAEQLTGKRVLYVNAYHQGYPWSDGISNAIQQVLQAKGIQLKIAYMDTKRRATDESKRVSALRIKAQIESFKPDAVIVSDDDPVQYLIVPYFKDEELPFVFCGVNWDASLYGLPYQNVTGVLEVSHLDRAIPLLQAHIRGKRMGFIAGDGFSERRLHEGYEKYLHFKFEQVYFAHNFEEWKQDYLALQNQVDIMLIESSSTVLGWNQQEAKSFVEQHIKIPIIASHEWLAPLMVLGIMKSPQEQGELAAQMVLQILAGTNPKDIPIVANQNDKLYINQTLAKKLGINFSAEVLKMTDQIIP
ncbi:MAG: ABC transporter substrate binding protein [Thiotrichaceae bacterium]|nr:ABC transporter substrate binding protein [Thiotrichaceae bacterium]